MPAAVSPKVFDFLRLLSENNNREWFTENKNLYTESQGNLVLFLEDLIKEMSEFDSELGKIDAKKSLFRIYRDTRFSKDKTPYKTNIGASLVEKGPKTLNHAGYYVHLEPSKSFLAGGVYMTEPKNLKAIREKISSEGENFLKILNKKYAFR